MGTKHREAAVVEPKREAVVAVLKRYDMYTLVDMAVGYREELRKPRNERGLPKTREELVEAVADLEMQRKAKNGNQEGFSPEEKQEWLKLLRGK